MNKLQKICKISAITLEGAGMTSITNFSAVFNSILRKRHLSMTDFVDSIQYFGSNSGATWATSMYYGSKELGVLFPLDEIQDEQEGYSVVSSFIEKYYWNPIRRSLHIKNLLTPDYKPTTLFKKDDILKGLKDFICVEQNMVDDKTKTELQMLNEIFGCKLTEEGFQLHIKSGAPIVEQINDFIGLLQYLEFLIESIVQGSWNSIVSTFVLEPFADSLRYTRMNDLTIFKESSERTNPKFYTVDASCLFESFCSYGTPSNGTNGYPNALDIQQYVTSEFIAYKWENNFLQPNKDIDGSEYQYGEVLGCMLAQYAVYGTEPSNKIREFTIREGGSDKPTKQAGSIVYQRRKNIEPLKNSTGIDKSQPVPVYNRTAYEASKNRSVLDANFLSSAAVGIGNSKYVLGAVIQTIINNLPQNSIIFALKNALFADSNMVEKLVTYIIYQIDRLILHKTSILSDNASDFFVSGLFFLNASIDEALVPSQPIPAIPYANNYTYTGSEYYKNGWNGIITSKTFEAFSNPTPTIPTRCVFNCIDGAPCMSDTGVMTLLQAIQAHGCKDEVHELIYFDNTKSSGQLQPFNPVSLDMSYYFIALFGNTPALNVINKIFIDGNIMVSTAVLGVPMPYDNPLLTASVTIFEPTDFSITVNDTVTVQANSWPAHAPYTAYDHKYFPDRDVYLKKFPEKLAEVDASTGIRIAQFPKICVTLDNEALNVKAGWKFKITVISTWSNTGRLPSPEKNAPQFTNEVLAYKIMLAQLLTLDEGKRRYASDDSLGAKKWIRKLFNSAVSS